MSSNQTDLSSYIVYLNLVSNKFTYYFMMSTVPVGVVGNLVSFVVYTRPRLNNKTNTGFLYACLCIVNLTSILYYTFVFRSVTLFNYAVYMPCGLSDYFRRNALNSVPWMQVMISLDRFVVVMYPSKKQLFTKKVLF